MLWVFDYTIPTLIVLVFFLIFYFFCPTIATNNNKWFMAIVIAEILGFFATMISSIFDNNHTFYSQLTLTIVNHLYYIMYSLRFLLYTRYFASLLHKKNTVLTVITYTLLVSVVVVVFSNPFTHLIYEVSPTTKFSVGPFVSFIYFVNISSVLIDFYYLTKSYKELEVKEKITLIFAVLILLSSCITDLFLMDYIISDMFFLLVMSLIFLVFENPDIYRDKKTRIYNSISFKSSMQDHILQNKDYPIFSFLIKNYNQLRQIYGYKQMDLVLMEIANYLLSTYTNKKLNFYHVKNGRFIFVDKGVEKNFNIQEKIEERFKKPWELKNGINILLKIVVIELDRSVKVSDYEDLERSVDEAVLFASQKNINHITITPKFFEKTKRKKIILKALHNAITNDTLEVFLQPLIDSKTKKIIAAEALVRLRDKELGLIPPDEFIGLAEEHGYIALLGQEVLNKVCIFLHNMEPSSSLKWINVNLSPIQCLDTNLLNIINRIVDSNKVPHSLIHLEITEECIIDLDILKNQMNCLINSGYKISLDDFGSGFSNLSLITELPFSNIKLDMSIVKGHCKTPDVILPGFVDTFRKKGLSITAEGVETNEMSEELENMGCNYLQGYCFSRPIPMSDFKVLLDMN